MLLELTTDNKLIITNRREVYDLKYTNEVDPEKMFE